MENKYIPLSTRSVLCISGEDAPHFLQGILTNDIALVNEKRAIYSLILTPQGKFLFEMFIAKRDDLYFIDCVTSQKAELLKKLKMYRLRSKVEIEDISDEYEAVALIGENVFSEVGNVSEAGSAKRFCKGVAYIDPRKKELFGRAIIERENHYQSFQSHDFVQGNESEYQQMRIENIVPDGEHDMVVEKSFPLRFNMAKLNAINFTKGCYVGQEVTTRIHHRGTIRQSIHCLKSDSDISNLKDKEIYLNDCKIGYITSSIAHMSLAMLENSIDGKDLQSTTFNCENFVLELC